MRLADYDSRIKDATKEASGEKTDEQLFVEIKNIKNRMENSTLVAYHTIGTKIKGFYGKNYGQNEMDKIAREIDLSTSTVYKIVQFAEKFSSEDIEQISEGAFQLSWHKLRDNLSLEKEEVLRVYRASHNPSEFSRKIKQIKQLSKCNQAPESDIQSEIQGEDEQNCPGVLNLPVHVSDKNLSETVANLHAEITELKSEIEQKNRQIDSLHNMILKKEKEWMQNFPEILCDLDIDGLMKLESSLIREKKRREIEENKEENSISIFDAASVQAA